MLKYRGWFVIPYTQARERFFINYFAFYVYNDANVIDDDNFAAVLESFVVILSLQVAQVNSEKVQMKTFRL